MGLPLRVRMVAQQARAVAFPQSVEAERGKRTAFDCDGDTLLIQVEQTGAACHEGFKSCFFRSIEGDGAKWRETEPRLETPEQIYGSKKP